MKKGNNVYHIEYWINKGFTKEESEKKVNDLKDRTCIYRIGYWINKGFTDDEAKEKISKIQKDNANKVNQKTKPNPTRLNYWINKGYTEDEAKENVKERQRTFNIKKCISKYGEVDGIIKYKNRQELWQKTLNENNDKIELNKKRGLTKEKYIEKHGLEKYNELIKIKKYESSKERYIEKFGEEKYIEKINKLKNSIRKAGFNKYSKISMELFISIENEIKEKCYYAKEEKIIQFYDENNKYFCFYVDFMFNNKIIEFYGDYYHANPLLYDENKIIGSKYCCHMAKDIWKIDNNRINLIKNKGFDVLIIWEKDYKNNKKEIINKCVKWIKNL